MMPAVTPTVPKDAMYVAFEDEFEAGENLKGEFKGVVACSFFPTP